MSKLDILVAVLAFSLLFGFASCPETGPVFVYALILIYAIHVAIVLTVVYRINVKDKLLQLIAHSIYGLRIGDYVTFKNDSDEVYSIEYFHSTLFTIARYHYKNFFEIGACLKTTSNKFEPDCASITAITKTYETEKVNTFEFDEKDNL